MLRLLIASPLSKYWHPVEHGYKMPMNRNDEEIPVESEAVMVPESPSLPSSSIRPSERVQQTQGSLSERRILTVEDRFVQPSGAPFASEDETVYVDPVLGGNQGRVGKTWRVARVFRTSDTFLGNEREERTQLENGIASCAEKRGNTKKQGQSECSGKRLQYMAAEAEKCS